MLPRASRLRSDTAISVPASGPPFGAITRHSRPLLFGSDFSPGGTAIGVNRHIVVADTDEEARRIAEPAFAHYHANLTYLWRMNSGDELVVRQAVPAANTFADSEREGTIIAGSPETVRRKITEQATELGLNYLLSYLMFGTLTLDQTVAGANGDASYSNKFTGAGGVDVKAGANTITFNSNIW